MKDQYYAGFMTDKPQFLREFPKGFTLLRRRFLAAITDVMTIFYLFVMGSYSVGHILYNKDLFFLIPWWGMLIIAVEGTALWESIGVSIGMRILGIRLIPIKKDNLGRHFLHYLLWHLSSISSLSLLWNSNSLPWHERASGLKVVKASEVKEIPRPWYTRSWSVGLVLVTAVSFLAAGYVTQVQPQKLFTGWPKTAVLWRQLFHPNWKIAGDGLRLLIVTIFMAVMATLFSIIIAIPLSFLAARNLSHGVIGRTVYIIVRTGADIMRSIDAIIWAIIFIVWVRAGPFPGMLALFVQATANLTKLYSERLESIDPGPPEAIRATGANKLQVILYGIVPQIINPYLSFTLYQWDINVRMSTVIGLVGGGGIGQMLIQYMRIWDYSNAGMMMLLIMVTVWAIDYTSSRLRAKLS